MSLHTRISEAYAAACGNQRVPADSGGGFIADEDPMLPLSSLSAALTSLGLQGDLYDEVYELLQDNAVMSTGSTRSGRARRAKAIPRDTFIETLAVALRDVPESALVDLNKGDEEESDDYDAGGEVDTDISEDDDLVDDFSDTEVVYRPMQPRLTSAQRDRAAFLYSIVLERVPLVPPQALHEQVPDRSFVRTVDAEEVRTRRIGIEELSFALQCLGEPMALKEMNEMLEVATPGSSERRLGLIEYVHY